jgi:hypothetical protein
MDGKSTKPDPATQELPATQEVSPDRQDRSHFHHNTEKTTVESSVARYNEQYNEQRINGANGSNLTTSNSQQLQLQTYTKQDEGHETVSEKESRKQANLDEVNSNQKSAVSRLLENHLASTSKRHRYALHQTSAVGQSLLRSRQPILAYLAGDHSAPVM